MTIAPKQCTGSGRAGHQGEYGKVGFSPCGEYVSHEKGIPCTLSVETVVNNNPINLEDCTCKTETCPCGSFVSHKISEICTA